MRQLWQAANHGEGRQYQTAEMAQFGRFLFIVDDSGLHPPRVWGGAKATSTSLNQAPRGSVTGIHQDRLWIGNLDSNGSRLIGSGVGDPFAWSLGRTFPQDPISLTLDTDDQDDITAITPTPQGDLIVFKTNSTHRYAGLIRHPPPGGRQEFVRSVVSKKIGCASSATVEQAGDDILWMSHVGVHSLGATDKYGDFETDYISSPVSDIWRDIPTARLKNCQAAYHSRLGMYLLGVPTRDSRFLNKLLALNRRTNQWMIWDIGEFTALGIGPGVLGERESIYVNLIRDVVVDGISGTPVTWSGFSMPAVLDFTGTAYEDFNFHITALTNEAIPVIIEPGDLFSSGDAEVRSQTKSGKNLHLYMSPSGDFESTVKYSWDGGEEFSETLLHNPSKKAVFGKGAVLGAPGGVLLTSRDDTRYATVRVKGSGRTFRFRVDDPNFGRLAAMHADLEFDVKQGRRHTMPPDGR
jgi:hypothetical protein